MSPFNLEGKTILITGASSGIGRATAILCAEMGASLIITGRNEERLTDTLDSLSGTGHKMFTADLADESEISRIIEQSPPLDGLVNNAGMIELLPSDYVTREKLDEVLAVNTYATITLFACLARKRKS